MGKRGPPPRPQVLVDLEGDRSKGKRTARDELVMPSAPEDLPPPSHLSEEAAQEWKRLYRPLQACGLLTATDLTAFEAYCATYARWREAEQELKTQACVVIDLKGSHSQNPWLIIAKQQLELMKSYIVEFGMTPASRARMATVASPQDKSKDAILQPEAAGKFMGMIGRK